jgi:hypothetical protein
MAGCTHRTAKNRDMRRHLAAQRRSHRTQIQEPRPLCPTEGCRYAQRGFARKDHLTRHYRNVHLRPDG